MAKRPVPKYNFKPFGDAIKAARNGRKESRNKVGDEMYISPRYLANIENKGQHPSLQIFFELVSRYHISVISFSLKITQTAKPQPAGSLIPCSMAWVRKKSKSSLPPFRLCWMPKRRRKNDVPGTTEYGLKDAMNEYRL